uniref:Secreted protein n=1 Tax=Magallana gigas TaxID=29159 RepID=A0A8W8MB03_MAGGI
MHDVKFTTTDGKMERFWLCLFLLTGAQGLTMYEDHGLRENPGDADHQHIDNCLENPVEAIGACLKEKGMPISVPYSTTADGPYVFEDNFFLDMCNLVTEANKCYGELESADCEMQVPKFVENVRQVISLMCPKKRELSRLIDCMNRRSFQGVVSSAANFDNQQVTMENLCSVADEKLQHGLNSTRSLCGEDDFRLL